MLRRPAFNRNRAAARRAKTRTRRHRKERTLLAHSIPVFSRFQLNSDSIGWRTRETAAKQSRSAESRCSRPLSFPNRGQNHEREIGVPGEVLVGLIGIELAVGGHGGYSFQGRAVVHPGGSHARISGQDQMSDHVWSLEEIAALTPQARGRYQKKDSEISSRDTTRASTSLILWRLLCTLAVGNAPSTDEPQAAA